jgi:hypothetical protein
MSQDDHHWQPSDALGVRVCTRCKLTSREASRLRVLECSGKARDAVIDEVRDDLLRRSQFGIKKYGVTLERTDLTLRDWLNHAYEEALDHANYLKRAIMEIDNAAK